MNSFDLTPYFVPLTKPELDKANYKGGHKRHANQKPRYTVSTAITIEGAKALSIHCEAEETNRLKVEIVDSTHKNKRVINTTGVLTDRFRNLVNNSKCVTCARETAYFRIESNTNGEGAHLNAYSSDHVMMTRDHIVPRSAGGPDELANYQLMCSPCNKAKGSLPMDAFVTKKLKQHEYAERVNKVTVKQLSMSVVQQCQTTFKHYPGLVATFTLTGQDLKTSKAVISGMTFFLNGEQLIYVPPEYNLSDYPVGHNELIHFEYFSLNAVFNSLKDIYQFDKFDCLYRRETECLYFKLDGTSVLLKDED